MQKKILTCHRLDRRTSGAVIFALRKDAAASVTGQFKRREVKKRYMALVRGVIAEEIYTDRPVIDHYSTTKKYMEAESRIRPLAHGSLPAELLPEAMLSDGLRETRYSLVEVELLTGKTHQARSHLAGLSHPVIGDNLHGDKLQNRLFADLFDTEEMFLRSVFLEFTHPADQQKVRVRLGPAASWLTVLQTLQLPPEFTALQEAEVSKT